mmetsp:Transcript_4197/g.12407  ORF Transcript_4197/g.12407 Transcript_4197/m.12407 type:complete len:213 (+) Transcript_4197:1218-1856(+)
MRQWRRATAIFVVGHRRVGDEVHRVAVLRGPGALPNRARWPVRVALGQLARISSSRPAEIRSRRGAVLLVHGIGRRRPGYKLAMGSPSRCRSVFVPGSSGFARLPLRRVLSHAVALDEASKLLFHEASRGQTSCLLLRHLRLQMGHQELSDLSKQLMPPTVRVPSRVLGEVREDWHGHQIADLIELGLRTHLLEALCKVHQLVHSRFVGLVR